MKSILEYMYCQRVRMKNDRMKNYKELCELSELAEKNKQNLKARLNDEEQILFEKYLDCTNELSSLECGNEFLTGFRLGGRMIMEIIFGADESELHD